MLPRTPALPNQPYVEVKKTWSMGECGHGMTFHRYSMLVDLVEEGFAQGDRVDGITLGRRTLDVIWGKPKVEMIEKVKTRRINQAIRIGVIVGAEEDRCCEDSLEALNHSPIMTTIGCKTKELEHLEGSFKADDTAFLLDRQGGYPYGDQSVLAEGQSPRRQQAHRRGSDRTSFSWAKHQEAGRATSPLYS